MRDIANRFSEHMDSIYGYIDLIAITINIAGVSLKGLRSNHDFVIAAIQVAKSIKKLGNFTIVVYEGAFLTVCSEYELVIRNLIETYIQRAVSCCSDYHHLPRSIREWYPEGCAHILLKLKHDKFSHLTKEQVLNSIASCVKPSKSGGYSLVGEAFSDNANNFWPREIEAHLERIGIDKIWQKLSREVDFQSAIGARDASGAEQRAKKKLDELLKRRNDMVHRGKSYYTPSESEVRDCIIFFKSLIKNLAEIMEKHISAI